MSDIRFNTWLHRTGSGGVYQDSSGNVGIGTSVPTSALSIVGVVSATSFSGNLTGNVTGQILGVQTSITVGDKFINSSGVGLGTTDTSGRNAGVGTATGTLVYNSTVGGVEYYDGSDWIKLKNNVEVTGGSVTISGTNTIRTFNSTDTLTVTGGPITSASYLIVAGGGGGNNGGGIGGGGGGAGGMRTGIIELLNGSYAVTVGGGGVGGSSAPAPPTVVTFGNPSFIRGTSGAAVGFSSITSEGGGGGQGSGPNPANPLFVNGGSGGGGNPSGPGGTGNRVTGTTTPAPTQGNNGGAQPGDVWEGQGGGGAGSANSGTTGGSGSSSTISGSSVIYAAGGGGGRNTWQGGGSAGAAGDPSAGAGGNRTGPASENPGGSGSANRGGGGGGGGRSIAGNGGSGVIIISYTTP